MSFTSFRRTKSKKSQTMCPSLSSMCKTLNLKKPQAINARISHRIKHMRNVAPKKDIIEDGMKKVEVPVTYTRGTLTFKNGMAVNARIFHVTDYHPAELFVWLEQSANPGVLLLDKSVSHMASLRVSYLTYGFNCFRGTLSVIYHSGRSDKGVNTLSTVNMTVERMVLNNVAKVLLLDRSHLLEVMRQLHVKCELGCRQQHIQFPFSVGKDEISISKAKRGNLRKVANKTSRIVCRHSTCVHLIKMIVVLNFSIAFKKRVKREDHYNPDYEHGQTHGRLSYLYGNDLLVFPLIYRGS